jgi:hypothetical protein
MGLVAWGVIVVGRLARPRVDPKHVIRLLIVAAAPTVVTWSVEMAGWWNPMNTGRAMAGLPLGLVAGAMLGAMASKDLR